MSERSDFEDEQTALYVNAVKDLLDQPAFTSFMVRWIVQLQEKGEVRGPIMSESLELANFKLGTQSFFKDFVESIQQISEPHYNNIMKEVSDYVSRRRRAARTTAE